VEHSIKVIIIN
ncbi:uncharacterized protein CELE_C26H9A.4, partial [Caenorhabditis elegans]